MRLTFFATEKEREQRVATAVCRGAAQHGDTCQIVHPSAFPAPSEQTDVALMMGVKGYSRLLFDDHRTAGKQVVYFDKGYLGRGQYFRVSVNSFQPLAYFQRTPRSDDRLAPFRLALRPMRTQGDHVILAGGSLKYAHWHGMNSQHGDDPMTTWARRTAHRLQHICSRPLVYRPKPSWRDATPLPGVSYSRLPQRLEELFENAWALVTYGSNAAVEALIHGIPVLILGDGIAQPLAKQSINSIEDLYIPSDEERWQWLADLSYCQFTPEEIASGLAWGIIREELHREHGP